jgi:hypothetical protein
MPVPPRSPRASRLRHLRRLSARLLAPLNAWERKRQARRARRLDVKVARASNVATSRTRLFAMALVSGRRVSIARALGGNPSTPRLVLRVFAHGPWDVAAAVAANASTPQRVLADGFILRPTWAVRSALASNASAPGVVLTQLATSDEAVLRMHTAANPSLPSKTVDALLRDPDVYVRAVAASNPRASAPALAALAEPMTDPAWVLRAVATNPTCPRTLSDEILTWIALGGTGNTDPTFEPLTCEGHPGDTTVGLYSWYRKAAQDNDTDMHPLWRVRSVITSTWPRIPGVVLMKLAVDPQLEVRRSVSGFKELTFARLKHLTRDADPQVAEGAIRALKNKGKGRRYWLRATPRRAILVPVVLTGFVISHVIGPQPGTSVASPVSGSFTNSAPAVLAGGIDNDVAVQLPGGGQLVAQPLGGGGSGVLILSTGYLALDIQLPVPAFTPFGSPLGSEVRLGTSSTTTITVNPTSVFLVLQITAHQSSDVTTTALPIEYEELR